MTSAAMVIIVAGINVFITVADVYSQSKNISYPSNVFSYTLLDLGCHTRLAYSALSAFLFPTVSPQQD
eukprot:scaffold361600_cov20-Prasinocladus_malaysianus.AAC.1